MSIYISNQLYLSEVSEVHMRRNRPLIGYHSVLRRSAFNFQYQSSIGGGSSIDGFFPSNIWSPLTASTGRVQVDVQDSEVTTIFTLDMANTDNSPVNYFGITAHNLGTAKAHDDAISPDIDIQLQYGHEGFDPADSFTGAATELLVPNDNSIMFHFDEQTAPFWRLRIIVNGYVDPIHPFPSPLPLHIGHVKLGRILQLERPMYVGIKPFGLGSESTGFNMESDNGNYLGQVITSRRRNWEIRQPNNTPEFTRNNVYDFINHLNGFGNGSGNGPKGTFFGAWRPDDYPSEVIYGWKDIEDDIYPVNSRSNGMMEWNARGKAIL